MACLVYNDDQGNQTRFPLGKATLMLGSSTDSEILLEDHSVSKNHASIIYDKGKFWVRDNGSTNGSLVNGKAVQLQALHNGDFLQFGQYKFFFDEFYQTNAQLEKTNSQDVKIVTRPSVERKGQSYRQTVQVQSAGNKAKGSIQMMLTPGLENIPDGLSKASQICGFLGFIAFLPAIVIGHMAQPRTALDKKNQITGLTLGYLFLVIWIGVFLYISNKADTTDQPVAKTTVTVTLDFPIIQNPLEMIKNPMVWLPPKGIYENILFDKPNTAIDGNATIQKQVLEIRSVFLHGIVWKQLPSFPFKELPSQQKLKYVYETYRTNPTFWEYNSTMLPEKKTYYDPFYFPAEAPPFFFDYDRALIPPLPRFADPLFKWCFGVRGLLFNVPAKSAGNHSLANLRVVLLVRAGDKPTTLNIKTIEGNLTRNEEKAYEYPIVPSTLYAAVVYDNESRKPVVVSTYEKYFSLEDNKKLEAWLDKNLAQVLSYQPSSEMSISPPFTIEEKVEAPQQAPAPEKPKVKVNFIIEPVKP